LRITSLASAAVISVVVILVPFLGVG